jgi:hypothetical protein
MRATLYRGSGARRNELMWSDAVGIALGGFGLFGWGDGAGTEPCGFAVRFSEHPTIDEFGLSVELCFASAGVDYFVFHFKEQVNCIFVVEAFRGAGNQNI